MQIALGEQVLIVGSASELGGWDASNGVPLRWTAGHVWTGEVSIPVESASKISYKIVKAVDGIAVEWEEGEDRTLALLDVPDEGVAVHASWSRPSRYVPLEYSDDVRHIILLSSTMQWSELWWGVNVSERAMSTCIRATAMLGLKAHHIQCHTAFSLLQDSDGQDDPAGMGNQGDESDTYTANLAIQKEVRS